MIRFRILYARFLVQIQSLSDHPVKICHVQNLGHTDAHMDKGKPTCPSAFQEGYKNDKGNGDQKTIKMVKHRKALRAGMDIENKQKEKGEWCKNTFINVSKHGGIAFCLSIYINHLFQIVEVTPQK